MDNITKEKIDKKIQCLIIRLDNLKSQITKKNNNTDCCDLLSVKIDNINHQIETINKDILKLNTDVKNIHPSSNFVRLTQSEYEALGTKDPDTVYIITQ